MGGREEGRGEKENSSFQPQQIFHCFPKCLRLGQPLPITCSDSALQGYVTFDLASAFQCLSPPGDKIGEINLSFSWWYSMTQAQDIQAAVPSFWLCSDHCFSSLVKLLYGSDLLDQFLAPFSSQQNQLPDLRHGLHSSGQSSHCWH